MPLTDVQTEIERVLLLDTDSKSLPDLPNKKNKTNWVEKSGGLPSYIERIAKHLHSEKGMDVSKAIASAVNTVKRWCAGGDDVKADTKAKACKAVAQWEAKKAKSKANLSVGPLPGEGKERLVVSHGVFLSASDAEFLDTLRVVVVAERDADAFDRGRYQLALSQARLNLGVTTFDPKAHPRDYKGQFKKAVGALKPGEAVKLPDGVEVKRTKEDQPVIKTAGKADVEHRPHYTIKGGEHLGATRHNPKHAGEIDGIVDAALRRSSSTGKAGSAPPDTLDDGGSDEIQVPDGSDARKAIKDGAASIPVGGEKTVAGSGLRIKREDEKLWRVYKSDGTEITTKSGIKGGPQAVASTVADTHMFEHGHPNFGSKPGEGERSKREGSKKPDAPATKPATKAPAKAESEKAPEAATPEDAGVDSKVEFFAVTKAVDRMVEGGSEDFAGSADEIRDIHRAIQNGPGDDMDYEAETILNEIFELTSPRTSRDPRDAALHEWAKTKLDAYDGFDPGDGTKADQGGDLDPKTGLLKPEVLDSVADELVTWAEEEGKDLSPDDVAQQLQDMEIDDPDGSIAAQAFEAYTKKAARHNK